MPPEDPNDEARRERLRKIAPIALPIWGGALILVLVAIAIRQNAPVELAVAIGVAVVGSWCFVLWLKFKKPKADE